jgi:hypothetical protein
VSRNIFLNLYKTHAGGLLFKVGNSNMQHVTSISFLLLAYSSYLSHANAHVPCGGAAASPVVLRRVAKRQVREPRRKSNPISLSPETS